PAAWRARYDTLDHILVNRPRSRAWSEALFTGTAGIWVHERGRYPLGCVEPGAEYERVRTQILEGLRGLTDPDGHRVFRSVQRRVRRRGAGGGPVRGALRAARSGSGGGVRAALRHHLREPAPRAALARALRALRGARLHRYPRPERALPARGPRRRGARCGARVSHRGDPADRAAPPRRGGAGGLRGAGDDGRAASGVSLGASRALAAGRR